MEEPSINGRDAKLRKIWKLALLNADRESDHFEPDREDEARMALITYLNAMYTYLTRLGLARNSTCGAGIDQQFQDELDEIAQGLGEQLRQSRPTSWRDLNQTIRNAFQSSKRETDSGSEPEITDGAARDSAIELSEALFGPCHAKKLRQSPPDVAGVIDEILSGLLVGPDIRATMAG